VSGFPGVTDPLAGLKVRDPVDSEAAHEKTAPVVLLDTVRFWLAGAAPPAFIVKLKEVGETISACPLHIAASASPEIIPNGDHAARDRFLSI
jgi:hypothetical protein